MIARLITLFVISPLIELAILIWIGTRIGFWPTIAIVVATGTLGALLARTLGARVLRQMQADLAAGRMPASHLLDGFLILVGGILLLTPGVLSDVAGIALLLPATRTRFKRALRRRLEWMIQSGQVEFIAFFR